MLFLVIATGFFFSPLLQWALPWKSEPADWVSEPDRSDLEWGLRTKGGQSISLYDLFMKLNSHKGFFP